MRHHVYVSDMEQYGKEDVWIASLKGDCEDYALWMQERVGGQLLYVRTESNEAHVELSVTSMRVATGNPIVVVVPKEQKVLSSSATLDLTYTTSFVNDELTVSATITFSRSNSTVRSAVSEIDLRTSARNVELL